MKKAAVAALCLILSAAMLIPVFAGNVNFKLDGESKGNEWTPYTGTYTKLMTGDDSNNNIVSAGMMYAFDESANCIWYFFNFSSKNLQDETSEAGIIINIENSDEIVCYLKESNSKDYVYSDDDYTVSFRMTSSNSEVRCEVKAVVIDGIGKESDFSVQFIDETGKPSIKKSQTVKNPDYETTESEQGTTSKSSGSSDSDDTTSAKKTTAARTKRATTSYKSRVTTRAVTTTAKQTSEKTTKEKTTKLKTTKVKTTKAKTTKTKTTKAKTTKEKTKAEYISSDAEETETTENISATTFETDGASLTSAYKIAAGIGAAVLFAVVGVWAVRSHNDASKADKDEEAKTDNKKDPEDK